MLPKYYEFSCTAKLLCGRKAVPNLPYELGQLGSSRPLVLTDQGIVKAGLMAQVEAAFEDSNIEIAARFDDVPVDSSDRVVNRIAQIYRAERCDALVAVGGGSVIDTAKGVNIVVSEGSTDLLEFQGVDRITANMQPFVAIPTTAGTGSEVTAAAVIYNERAQLKMAFMSGRLMPDVAIVDPVMMQTMPPRITAATGMDALTHAVEAFIDIAHNPISDAFATSAIKLIHQHLLRAVQDGDDLDARLAMANAAVLAGVAFSNSMVGIVHALAHASGGVWHVPHGVANAIFLPWGMEYNLGKVKDAMAELGVMLGASCASSADIQARHAVDRVRALGRQLNAVCGLPTTLREAGVPRDKLKDIARLAQNDGALTFSPEEADLDDLMQILNNAW
jgi:alcohol dehydrogenase